MALHAQVSKPLLLSGILLYALSAPLFGEDGDVPVVTDDGIEITAREFSEALRFVPPSLIKRASTDDGERFELLNQLVVSRKKAQAADAAFGNPGDQGYWDLKFRLISAKSTFYTERKVGEYKLPDVAALARERYLTEKDKWAWVPERRKSSHILFLRRPGEDRTQARALAAELIDRIEAGASFGALVDEYSEDPNSRRKGGAVDSWVTLGGTEVAPTYSEALFKIKQIGGVVQAESEFGVHVIRLDDIKEGFYKSFEEVRGRILGAIKNELQQLARLELIRRFSISDEAYINDAVLNEIFREVVEAAEK